MIQRFTQQNQMEYFDSDYSEIINKNVINFFWKVQYRQNRPFLSNIISFYLIYLCYKLIIRYLAYLKLERKKYPIHGIYPLHGKYPIHNIPCIRYIIYPLHGTYPIMVILYTWYIPFTWYIPYNVIHVILYILYMVYYIPYTWYIPYNGNTLYMAYIL